MPLPPRLAQRALAALRTAGALYAFLDAHNVRTISLRGKLIVGDQGSESPHLNTWPNKAEIMR